MKVYYKMNLVVFLNKMKGMMIYLNLNDIMKLPIQYLNERKLLLVLKTILKTTMSPKIM